MNSVKITLAGREYNLAALPIRASRDWRQKLGGKFDGLMTMLSGAGKIELSNGADIAALMGVLRSTIVDAPDLVFNLLLEYSPDLAAERERLEAEAFDDEVFAAFIEVLKIVYPFGKLMPLVK